MIDDDEETFNVVDFIRECPKDLVDKLLDDEDIQRLSAELNSIRSSFNMDEMRNINARDVIEQSIQQYLPTVLTGIQGHPNGDARSRKNDRIAIKDACDTISMPREHDIIARQQIVDAPRLESVDAPQSWKSDPNAVFRMQYLKDLECSTEPANKEIVAGGISAHKSLPSDDVMLRVTEYLVTSSNTLYDLGMVILCSTPTSTANDRFLFFISGVFYSNNDDEHAKEIIIFINTECSGTSRLRQPADRACGSAQPAVLSAKKSTFRDLRIRLGHPYVFVHKECCEHLIVFQEIRHQTSSDPKCVHFYPKKLYQSRAKTVMCELCNRQASSEIVFSSAMPKSPCCVCGACRSEFKTSRSYHDDVSFKFWQ